MAKHKPLRQCLSCKEMKEKDQLIRVVKNKAGQVFLDLEGKANGRGAYLCKDEECLNKAIKNSALNRSLRTKVSDQVYEEIRNEIK